MAPVKTNILTAEQEDKLRQSIDEYVGSIQAKIDALRADGSDKVAEIQANLDSLKRDRIYTQQEKALLHTLIGKLSALDGVVINGSHQAPHILSISIPGVPTQNTINILQESGICVSAGSACAKGHRSHVLSAMHLPPEVIDSSIRVSLSRETTREEIDGLIRGIEAVLAWKK